MKRRERILEVSEELFAQKGYEGTSIREICKIADVNLAMINYYFESKQGLLKEVLRERSIRRGKAINEVVSSDDSINKQIYKMVSYFTRSIFENQRLFRLVTRELSTGSDYKKELEEIIHTELDRIKMVFDRNIENDYNLDLDLLILTTFSVVNTLITLPSLFYEPLGYSTVEDLFHEQNFKPVTDKITNFLFQLYLNSLVESK